MAFVVPYHYRSISIFQPTNWVWGLPQTHPCAHEGVWWEADAGPVGGKGEDQQFHISVHDFLSGLRCMCVERMLDFSTLSSSLVHSAKVDSWKTRICYTTVTEFPNAILCSKISSFSWPTFQFEPERHLFPDFESDPEMGIYIFCVCLLNALKYLQSYDNFILFRLFPSGEVFLPDVYIE